MNLISHIRIANQTLKSIDDKIDCKVYKPVYLLGSIAPDLNVAFPKHTIRLTINRWKRRLRRVDKTSSDLVKSFMLGVIIHYICDYFCYVHNIRSHGLKHKIYEIYLARHIKMQSSYMEFDNEELIGTWDTLIHQIESNNKCSLIPKELDIIGLINIEIDAIDKITDVIIQMNKIYKQETINNTNQKYKDIQNQNQLGLDLKYAKFISTQIALIFLSSTGL